MYERLLVCHHYLPAAPSQLFVRFAGAFSEPEEARLVREVPLGKVSWSRGGAVTWTALREKEPSEWSVGNLHWEYSPTQVYQLVWLWVWLRY